MGGFFSFLAGLALGVGLMALFAGLIIEPHNIAIERSKAVKSGAARWAINAETGEKRFEYLPRITGTSSK